MSSGGGGGVAGGVFGVAGSLMEAQSTSNAYNLQAEQLRRNAKLDREVGQFNVMRQQIVANKKFGAMSSDYAASGIAADSGSVQSALTASHANSELDRLSIIHGAEMRASGMETRADQDVSAASQAQQAGYLNAVSSLFMSGKSVNMSGPTGGDGSVSDTSYGSDSGSGRGGYGTAGGRIRGEEEYA